MKDQVKWDGRYLDLARLVGTWSKDPSTKVGAVVVGEHGQILSTGYNGFPRGVYDDPSTLNDREAKYDHTIHAEMNCVFNAGLTGTTLKGGTLYVDCLPEGIHVCNECAKGVIQSGIKRVVMRLDPDSERALRWKESGEKAAKLMGRAGVEVTYVSSSSDRIPATVMEPAPRVLLG